MSDWYLARHCTISSRASAATHPQDFSGAQMVLMSKILADDGRSMTCLPTFIRWTAGPPAAPCRQAARHWRAARAFERGISNAYVAIADRDHVLHDPETFIRKYIWSQDHKVIAIQYSITAIAIGLVALGMSVLMRLQLGFRTPSRSSRRTTITSSSPCTA